MKYKTIIEQLESIKSHCKDMGRSHETDKAIWRADVKAIQSAIKELEALGELKNENKYLRNLNEAVDRENNLLRREKDRAYIKLEKLQTQNRDLVRVIKNSIETLKDIKGFTGNREDKNNLIKCVINDLEKVREANAQVLGLDIEGAE